MSSSAYRDILGERGCVAIPLQVCIEDVSTFIHAIEEGGDKWFQQQLWSALHQTDSMDTSRDSKTVRSDNEIRGEHIFSNMSEEDKRSVIRKYTTRTDIGQREIFIGSTGSGNEDLDVYLKKRVRYAVNGGCKINMGTLVAESWALSGFGLWSHVHPGNLAYTIVKDVSRKIRSTIGVRYHLRSSPGMIYKPVGGKALPVHNDSFNPSTLHKMCVSSVLRNSSKANLEWAVDHGYQSLAHIRGGVMEGSTYIIGPMTPFRMLVCMSAVHPQSLHPEISKYCKAGSHTSWWGSLKGGPCFFKWDRKEVLLVVNRLINRCIRISSVASEDKNDDEVDTQWLRSVEKHTPDVLRAMTLATEVYHPIEALKRLPIVPDDKMLNPFVAVWLNGFLHGSMANKTQSRLTMTVDLGKDPARTEDDLRFLVRARMVSRIAYSSGEVARKAHVWLENDPKCYVGGPTHKRTKKEISLMASTLGGPFQPLAPTEVEVDRLERWVERQTAFTDLNIHRSVEDVQNVLGNLELTLMDIEEDDSASTLPDTVPEFARSKGFKNMRLLNVKQPHAWALMAGHKTIENRSHHLKTSNLGEFPIWVLLVASKSMATQKDIKETKERMSLIGKDPNLVPKSPKDYQYQSVIGLIRFDASVDFTDNAWFNGPPGKAWVVGASIPFLVPNIEGSQTPNRRLDTHKDRDRIMYEMDKIVF